MRHLFDSWAEVKDRIRAASNVALFLDFDGTLAWIAARPSHATLPPPTRSTLKRLAQYPAVRVCIISARDYPSLSQLVRVPRVRCLGMYGWQNGNALRLAETEQRALQIVCSSVVQHIKAVSGVWVENKGQAFAVHYRAAADEAIGQAGDALRKAMHPFRDVLRVIPGKMAWDVLPSSVRGKGAAVRRELPVHPAGLAIYAGDDVSDESAFQSLPDDGISVHVGSR